MKSTRILLKIHRWTGLISGINILILSVTGAYLVFSEEIHHYFEAPRGDILATVNMSAQAPMQDAVDALLPQYPGMVPYSVFAPEHEADTRGIILRQGREIFLGFELDTSTGHVYEHVETTADKVNDFILHLHTDLFLGTLGILFLSVVATLFLISTVTGMIIYGPFMKQAIYGALRWDRGWRRSSADLHKVVGISSLGFNFVMALTGIALTLGLTLARLWLFNEAGAMIAADAARVQTDVVAPAVDTVWQEAALLHPEIPIKTINFPEGMQGPHHFLVWYADPDALSRFIPQIALVARDDPDRVLGLEVPLWIQAALICVPFHFGNFGGLPVKVAYAVFGLSAGLLAISGAVLTFSAWGKRRRLTGRATAPGSSLLGKPKEEALS